MSHVKTVMTLIESYAGKNPEAIAIRFGQHTMSYHDLNHQANQLAHYLYQLKLKPDSVVAVCMRRTPALLVTILAILKSGCAWLPLDESQPLERLQDLLKDAAPALLITQNNITKLSEYRGRRVILDRDMSDIMTHPGNDMLLSINANQLAYMIYTSGSTGKPKGVLIEHKSLLNYVRWFAEYSRCNQQDKIDFSSNYIFDMAITSSICALALGLEVVICPDEIKKNIRHYLEFLAQQNINITKMTPSFFRLLLNETRLQPVLLPDLQSIILGGENLLTADCMNWLGIYPAHHLFNEYGPTEATVAVTQYEITHETVLNSTSVPIGKPGLNIECRLQNGTVMVTTPDSIGELYVGGECLARGYLNRSELTAERFVVLDKLRWYKTGDLCRYLPDGSLEYCGRIDEQVKIHGYRIEPGEIERCLEKHARVKNAIVIAQDVTGPHPQLIAYYVPQDVNNAPSHHELRHFMRQKIADYMMPAQFVTLSALPLTANGKIDKKAFPPPAISLDTALQPVSLTEQILVDIWRGEFHLNSIGVNHNFFELGGHSLLAARIVTLVERYLHKKIKVQDVYKADNVRELACMVEAAEISKQKPQLEISASKTDIIPLSDFQFMYWISELFEPKVRKLNIVIRKRIDARLDLHALYFAFESVFKKHEVLTYEMASLMPYQRLNKNYQFKIDEKDLSYYDDAEQEYFLTASLTELLDEHVFSAGLPLVGARLFYLNHHHSELQLCLPHSVFDDASAAIIFAELSNAYLQYLNGIKSDLVLRELQFKDYVSHERSLLNHQIKQDIIYWQDYLHDTGLLTLPKSVVISDMDDVDNVYSTYLEIPNEFLLALKSLSTEYRLSTTDVICAAITLALKRFAGRLNHDKILLNIVKSSRDQESFDNMIGCFLHLDPLKVDIHSSSKLPELARTIQAARIETEPHQYCSGMVKLACLNKSFAKSPLKDAIVKTVTRIYSKLFKKMALNAVMLHMYWRLNGLRSANQFLVNINILTSFTQVPAGNQLFGAKIMKTPLHRYNMTNVDNVLDICLMRDDGSNKCYLVVSGNLLASFRQQIGNEMIGVMIETGVIA